MNFEITSPDPTCACGCGGIPPVSTYTHRPKGRVRGQHVQFIHGHSGGRPAVPLLARCDCQDRGYETPCLIWLGAKTTDGYAHVRRQARAQRVHVLFWEEVHGHVPDGLELDHLCNQRDCVEPSHCAPVTHLENIQRGKERRQLAL